MDVQIQWRQPVQSRYFARQLENTTYVIQNFVDGDAASFTEVAESQPYRDELKLAKLECVEHYQKQTGNRLQQKIKDLKRVKPV